MLTCVPVLYLKSHGTPAARNDEIWEIKRDLPVSSSFIETLLGHEMQQGITCLLNFTYLGYIQK